MASDLYEALRQGDDEIVVRDIGTGYVFTFGVEVNPLGERLLSKASVAPNEGTSVRSDHISGFVWRYAEGVMLQAGKIARLRI